MNPQLAIGFNRLAPIYDSLARLIIGKGIHNSQLHFLNYLKGKSKLLILGGGTGWILPHIVEINPALSIDYIELSPEMLLKAQQSLKDCQNVKFILGTEDNIPRIDYDCVLTNFYLDLFIDSKMMEVTNQIKSSFTPNACWIATDFVSMRLWHKVVLWIMYRFFSIVTGLKTLSLPQWQNSIHEAGGKVIAMKSYSRGFIKTIVYEF